MFLSRYILTIFVILPIGGRPLTNTGPFTNYHVRLKMLMRLPCLTIDLEFFKTNFLPEHGTIGYITDQKLLY
jgi:hypothetical protein